MNIKKNQQYGRTICVVLFAAATTNAFATGIIKVESNGFLRRSVDRADSSSTLSIGPEISRQGKILEGKLDPKAIVQVSDTQSLTVDRSAFTVEAANAYIATSKIMMSKHQFTLGRRVNDWSRFDDEWEFGAVSPRFIWDPTRPEKIGLTGIFHTYESRHWRVSSYASPVSIPERGYPLRNEGGRLLSTNPFQTSYYESAVIANRNIPINYNVVYPPMSELLLNSGAMTSVRWSSQEKGKGVWAQGLYGFLPVHQANLALDISYPAQADAIRVDIHPEIQRHHLLSFEMGIEKPRYALWASVTEEVPTQRNVPTNWVTTKSEPAFLASFGGEVRFARHWKVKSTFLYVDEEQTPVQVEQDFTVDLPGRFPFQRAARGGIEYRASDRMTYELSMIADLEMQSELMSFDLNYTIPKKDHALTLSLGSDFFASATSKGYLGQYKGNDRFRGGIAYAF